MDKVYKLTHVWVDITAKCNNKCPYCYDMGNGNTDVDLEQLKKIFALINELHIPNVTLIGGEPTMHKDFLQILEIANSVSNPAVVTNGTMFAKTEFAKQVAEIGIRGVLFSLTSPFEDVHDKTTGRKGAYKEVIKGIENALSYLSHDSVRTSTTITQNNACDLQKIMDINKAMGISTTIFNACVPSISDMCGESCLHPTELARAIEDAYVYGQKIEQSIRVATNLPYCIFSDDLRESLRNDRVIATSPCQVYRGSGYEFLSTGAIIPCTHLHDCILGNPIADEMNGDDFIKFINTQDLIQSRRSMWRYPSQECKKCSEWGRCVGGCPIMWSAFEPKTCLKAIL